MEENKQIIYHKSDWGSQVIKIILVLCFLFFSYKKNPTKELFTQELIKEYAIKNGIDNSIYWYADASNGVKWEGDDGYFVFHILMLFITTQMKNVMNKLDFIN